MLRIIEGSLHIHDGCNAYYLYGFAAEDTDDHDAGDLIHVACLGADGDFSDYDPNDDYELIEEHNLETVSLRDAARNGCALV